MSTFAAFKHDGPGCCGCGEDYILSLGTVCPPGALGGVAVTITGPGYSQTHTTDSSGHATFTGIEDGVTYTISFPPVAAPFTPPRYTQGTTTFTPPTIIPNHIGSGMTPAPGYLCNSVCNRPISNRLTLTVLTDEATGATETVTLAPGPGGFGKLDDYVGTGGSGASYDFFYSIAAGLYQLTGGVLITLQTNHSTCDPFEVHYHGTPPSEFDEMYWSVTEGTPVP